MLPDHPQNEILLFGFSRGACQLIDQGRDKSVRSSKFASTPEFDRDVKRALRVYQSSRETPKAEEVGQVFDHRLHDPANAR